MFFVLSPTSSALVMSLLVTRFVFSSFTLTSKLDFANLSNSGIRSDK